MLDYSCKICVLQEANATIHEARGNEFVQLGEGAKLRWLVEPTAVPARQSAIPSGTAWWDHLGMSIVDNEASWIKMLVGMGLGTTLTAPFACLLYEGSTCRCMTAFRSTD